jgi:hypothetical protein
MTYCWGSPRSCLFVFPFSLDRIFEIAPTALDMYSFAENFAADSDELYHCQRFLTHARGVIDMLDAALNMMGPDVVPLQMILFELGSRHVAYGVLPAHYGIVGEALLYTLATALGDKWTPHVKRGWASIFRFISTAMMEGANTSLKKAIERKKLRKLNRRKITSRENSFRKKRGRTISPVADGGGGGGARRVLNHVLDQAMGVAGRAYGSVAEAGDTLAIEQVCYSQMVVEVYTTWDMVKAIPNYAEVAGVLLFKK